MKRSATCIAAILIVWWAGVPLVAQESQDLGVFPAEGENAAPVEMVGNYLLPMALDALDSRRERYEALKTTEELAAYQQRMREFFLGQLGEKPERTPLRPQSIGRDQRDGYAVERVIYESRPKHFVTAALYLPDAEGPVPGVLVPCGHSANGKAAETYQRASILLARNGFAALCYDPIGQGERSQLLDDNGAPRFGSTIEHTQVGVGSILLGTNTAAYRIWDGIRSLDYLASRPEVDPDRLGCTGNSGGGTMTAYLMALDSRIRCAAPSCYLTSFERLLITRGPQDAEQNIHAQIAFGMNHADYVLMRAPRPTLMCVATRDFFDIDGAWDAFRQAKRFYTRYGFSERVDLVETDAEHGFSIELRTGMVRWMRRWLLGRNDPVFEPDFPIASDEELQCTPDGQVMRLHGARSVFALNRELLARHVAERDKRWHEAPPASRMAMVRRLVGVRPMNELPQGHAVAYGSVAREGYRIEKVALATEPGIVLPALVFKPDTPRGEAYLYLHDEGKHVDALPGGPIETLVRAGNTVMAVDVRGIGETATNQVRSGWDDQIGQAWRDYFLAYMLDKTFVGMRAEDILVFARHLAAEHGSGSDSGVRLVAVGRMTVPALHAAALEPDRFASVELRGGLSSWASVIATDDAALQLENTVHGALLVYDLPHLIARLPSEKIRLIDMAVAAGPEVTP